MTSAKEFLDQFRPELQKAETEIERLKAKAQVANAEAREAYEREVAELREQKNKIEERMKLMQNASDQARKDIQVGVEAAWRDLQTAMKSASDRF
jgi:chromosome segregation ATPase